jgi:hypothetical protein
MQNRYATHLYEEDEPATWRPQSGEVLTGVIDRYTVSETPQGFVRTVIVTEERTGEQVSLRLASMSLLALFAQHQPHPGERMDLSQPEAYPGHRHLHLNRTLCDWHRAVVRCDIGYGPTSAYRGKPVCPGTLSSTFPRSHTLGRS